MELTPWNMTSVMLIANDSNLDVYNTWPTAFSHRRKLTIAQYQVSLGWRNERKHDIELLWRHRPRRRTAFSTQLPWKGKPPPDYSSAVTCLDILRPYATWSKILSVVPELRCAEWKWVRILRNTTRNVQEVEQDPIFSPIETNQTPSILHISPIRVAPTQLAVLFSAVRESYRYWETKGAGGRKFQRWILQR